MVAGAVVVAAAVGVAVVEAREMQAVDNELRKLSSPAPAVHCSTPVKQLGIGWRPEMALAIARRNDLKFVEIVAENYLGKNGLPQPLRDLRADGVAIIPHCISLSPGGAERPDGAKVRRINELALECGAPLVSDHLCFVRAKGLESGHLLPVPRSRESLRVVIDNVRFIKDNLTVPFALENIASICDWNTSEMDEASFFAEVLEQTDSLMLLDVANLYANAINHKFDAVRYLERLPLHRIAYVHVAGGVFRNEFYHDTHAHQVIEGVYALLQELCDMAVVPRVMLERDDHFPSADQLNAELDHISVIALSPARTRFAPIC